VDVGGILRDRFACSSQPAVIALGILSQFRVEIIMRVTRCRVSRADTCPYRASSAYEIAPPFCLPGSNSRTSWRTTATEAFRAANRTPSSILLVLRGGMNFE